MRDSAKNISIKYIIPLFVLSVFFVLSSFIGSSVKTDMDRAEKLYIKHCSHCHRKDGRGIKRVYPPLKNADYIEKASTEELLRGMIFGRSGRITVNGITYNGVMTTEVDKSLNDKEIAMILTYVYKELNDINITVSAGDVKKARKAGKLPPHGD